MGCDQTVQQQGQGRLCTTRMCSCWTVSCMIIRLMIQCLTCLVRYLLRAEIIALHAASNYPGAQFYMECAQINVRGASVTKRGDGHGSPSAPRRHLATRAGAFSPSYVSFPGAYKGTDPGVKFQLYW